MHTPTSRSDRRFAHGLRFHNPLELVVVAFFKLNHCPNFESLRENTDVRRRKKTASGAVSCLRYDFGMCTAATKVNLALFARFLFSCHATHSLDNANDRQAEENCGSDRIS